MCMELNIYGTLEQIPDSLVNYDKIVIFFKEAYILKLVYNLLLFNIGVYIYIYIHLY